MHWECHVDQQAILMSHKAILVVLCSLCTTLSVILLVCLCKKASFTSFSYPELLGLACTAVLVAPTSLAKAWRGLFITQAAAKMSVLIIISQWGAAAGLTGEHRGQRLLV